MTQYLLSVWHTGVNGENYDAVYASDEEMQAAFAATEIFNEEIKASGNFVFGGGLMPPASATVVDNTTPDVVITDGPFSESKEVIGGFWVVEARDLDEAMAIAARGSKACVGKVEVRPFQGMA
jgi:hypothetical protein